MAVTISAIQMACGPDPAGNLDRAGELARQAAREGSDIVVLQELVAHQLFYNFGWREDFFELAETLESSRTVGYMQELARELHVVIPVNFFEQAGQAYFNTTAVVDADGTIAGTYRKSHMPLGPPTCYEKYYTSPGDTGFGVFDTAAGRIGCCICWDQWFPEAARVMSLRGAELLIYPTAIGSDCHDHWRTAMCGRAASNMVPVVAANRVGTESASGGHSTTYWGRSFITDHFGTVIAEAGTDDDEIITASVDPQGADRDRAAWGLFRDRRPDLYRPLLTMDGSADEPAAPPGPPPPSTSASKEHSAPSV